MVSIQEVRTSNSTLKSRASGLVALFVGATSGIGLGTLKALAKNFNAPKVYIVGRSAAKSQDILAELKSLNPTGTFTFLEGEVSLIKQVDKVCAEVLQKESHLDLLFMSPGFVEFGERQYTPEDIDILTSLRYYARMRFLTSLLPLLSASSSPRVVTVLAGGKEGELDTTDIDLRKPGAYTFIKAGGVSSTTMTLGLEEIAKSHPEISFCHVFPGFVNTGLLEKTFGGLTGWKSILGTVAQWVLLPVLNYFAMTAEVAGERGLYVATSEKYPSAKTLKTTEVAGMKCSNGENGVYRVDEDGSTVVDDTLLGPYRQDGVGAKVWDHTMRVFDRAMES